MNFNSLHRMLEHMRENVKQRYALLYKKPHDEEKKKKVKRTERKPSNGTNCLLSCCAKTKATILCLVACKTNCNTVD